MRRSQAKALARLHNDSPMCVSAMWLRVWATSPRRWARGTGTESEVEHILTRVPSSRFFEVVHHDRLRPRGRLLPTARLPDVRWVPLPEWLSIRIPTPALPGAELSDSTTFRRASARGRPRGPYSGFRRRFRRASARGRPRGPYSGFRRRAPPLQSSSVPRVFAEKSSTPSPAAPFRRQRRSFRSARAREPASLDSGRALRSPGRDRHSGGASVVPTGRR